jgi:hypothetical protein
MKHLGALPVAVFLLASLVHPAAAQAPALTNADVVRLVAMRVSDQTVIAVVQEALATQFDLSPQAAIELAGKGVPVAVIGAMRQSAALSTRPAIGAAIGEPALGGQTLAGAAAEAAAAAQARQLSAAPAPEPAVIVLAPAKDDPSSPAPAPAPAPVPAPPPDEAAWRARVAPLRLTLRDNRAKEGPLLNQLNALTATLSRLGPSDVKRRAVETERQRVTADLTALREALRADLAAVQLLEEEGRRAGVPPAWLR